MSLCAAAVAAIAGNASAQTGSFSFAVSPSEPVLVAPDDPVVQHIESWDSPLMRIIKRSRPFIEIVNTSDEGVQLTEFRMTIGDADFNFSDDFFGAFTVLGDSTPGVDISSTTEMGGDELVISFGGGGLAPGEVVRFQVDIDGDPGVPGMFIHPDYRTVFFDIYGDDNSDNSVLTANFIATLDGDQELQATGVQPDLDKPVGSAFIAPAIRPYSVMEMVEVTGFEDTTVVIPEPSAVLLLLMASAGFGAAFMRRRLG
ncbi:MAG: PEP-CTERM sorting domain-containing protein [Planctomycetota bacterium]